MTLPLNPRHLHACAGKTSVVTLSHPDRACASRQSQHGSGEQKTEKGLEEQATMIAAFSLHSFASLFWNSVRTQQSQDQSNENGQIPTARGAENGQEDYARNAHASKLIKARWSRKESLGPGNPGHQRSGAVGEACYGPSCRID
jgi:hypothetical protein